MSPDMLDVFALGLRLGAGKNSTAIGDDLFTSEELGELFKGNSQSRLAKLREWLAEAGVQWNSGSVIDAVAKVMAARRDRHKAETAVRVAQRQLARLEQVLRCPHLAGPEMLSKAVETVLAMKLSGEPPEDAKGNP